MLHSSYKFCRFVLPVIVITETFCFFSCVTTRLISNSNGFDYNTNPEISLIKEKPDWLNKGMYQETLLDGNYYYVVGSYIGNTKKPNADKADVAESEAAKDAKVKLAEFLSSDVTIRSSSMMSGENWVKEMAFNGKNSTLSQGEYYDSLYTDTYVESTASFSGLALNDRFFSLFEDTEENKRYYNYWCRFRISEKDLKKAQEEMKNKKDLTSLEIARYNDLKSSTLRTIQFLKDCNFMDNEEQFKSLYFELVNNSSELRGLDYFNKLDLGSEEKKDYDGLIKQISEILEEYDPTDIQKQQYLYRIRTLEKPLYIYNTTPGFVRYTDRYIYDFVEAWIQTYKWLEEFESMGRLDQAKAFVRQKIVSRQLLYAKLYVQQGHNLRELNRELERIGALEILKQLPLRNMIPSQKKELAMFQESPKQFVKYAKKEGWKIRLGRLLLKVRWVRRMRDRKRFPMETEPGTVV